MGRLLPNLQEETRAKPTLMPVQLGNKEWLPIGDVMFRGAKSVKRDLAPKEMFFRIDEEELPSHPEAHTTIYTALAEICAIVDHDHPVQQLFRELKASLPQEQQPALDRLRIRHQRRLEAAIDWYLRHYFRFFDNRPPPRHKLTREELVSIWPDRPPVLRS